MSARAVQPVKQFAGRRSPLLTTDAHMTFTDIRRVAGDFVEHWSELAACRGESTDLFCRGTDGTARNAQREREVKAICARCSVRPECRDDADRTRLRATLD